MALRPKHELKKTHLSIERKFTDREEPIRFFMDFLGSVDDMEYRLLMYHGIGGIGKTTLRKKLCNYLNDEKDNIVWAVIDFDTQTFREQETALYLLRRSLSAKYNIQFPSFDIAYAIYWKRTHPQIQMNKDNFKLLGESDPILASIIEITAYAAGFGLVHKIAKGVIKGGKFLNNWWKKRGKDEINKITDMDPNEILEHLPMFWALDFKDFLEDSGKTAVLFIDTYEALWTNIRSEGSFLSRDEWVRELVLQLPGVLWTICGRERIRWDEVDSDWADCITNVPLGNFSETDAMKFLTGCGIESEEIRQVIYNCSKGVPYYLDISVDTFHGIKRTLNREPKFSDFAQTPLAIIERFLRYLSAPEKETLKVLSSPRFFDYDLFKDLVEEFGTRYPLTAFEDLCRFSFITESEIHGKFYMHELMRESLQNTQNSELLKRVHNFMFEHYNSMLADIEVKNITNYHGLAFVEGVYHARHSLNPDECIDWLLDTSDTFIKAARWRFLKSIYEDIAAIFQDVHETEHPGFIKLQSNLGKIYYNLGIYDEAESIFKLVLDIHRKTMGEEHPEVASSMSDLAELYIELARYKEAEPLHINAMKIRAKALGDEHPDLAESLKSLGKLYYFQGKYTDAEPLYKRSLEIYEKTLGSDHLDVASLLNNLAGLYDEQRKYSDAESLYRRALVIREKALGPEHLNVALILNNLAGLEQARGDYPEAERLYKRTLEIFEQSLGPEHHNVATLLNNLAGLYRVQHLYSKAEPLYERALEILKTTLGQEHPNVAGAIYNLAGLYRAEGNNLKAEAQYRSALAIFENALGEEHPSVATVLTGLAGLLCTQSKYPAAEPLYKRALNIFENSFGTDSDKVAKIRKRMEELYLESGIEPQAGK